MVSRLALVISTISLVNVGAYVVPRQATSTQIASNIVPTPGAISPVVGAPPLPACELYFEFYVAVSVANLPASHILGSEFPTVGSAAGYKLPSSSKMDSGCSNFWRDNPGHLPHCPRRMWCKFGSSSRRISMLVDMHRVHQTHRRYYLSGPKHMGIKL